MDRTLHDPKAKAADDFALVRRLSDAGPTFPVRVALEAGASRAAIERLVRAGLVAPVSHGVYTVLARPMPASDELLRVATAPVRDEPHYVSWWAALAHHGMTEQDPLVVAIAVRQRHRDRAVGGARVRFVFQGPDRFYGWSSSRGAGAPVRIARAEKAIIDSLDRPDLAGGMGEVVKALVSGRYDLSTLFEVARRFPSRATVQRLGYLIEALELGDASALRESVDQRGPKVLLDLGEEADGEPDPRWWILDNVGTERLTYLRSR
jgi:predicted transcriptional regulator of viral defense system